MQITEIYRSIQGESSYAGLPCIFVRLTGCNLRCNWCDTEYSFVGGRKMSLAEVKTEIRRLAGSGLVELTGGEPMLQEKEAVELMQWLVSAGYKVLLETSGERRLANVPKEVVKIVDVKCPHSGEADTFDLGNLEFINDGDEIKFVITDRTDYEFAREFARRHLPALEQGSIIFSPAFHKNAGPHRDSSNLQMDPRELAQWILDDGLGVRLGLQIHKFIWDPSMKGV